jgi:hypothetical protein
MSDRHDLLDLPILDELGADLSRAFRAAEAEARPARRGRVPRGRWPAFALAAALAVLAVVAVAPWTGPGTLGPADATAAQVLARAADVAARDGRTVVPGSGQYAFSDEVAVTGVFDAIARGPAARRSAVFQLTRRQTWQSATRPSVAKQWTLDETPPGALPPTLTVEREDLRPAGPGATSTQTVPGRRGADGSVRIPVGRARVALGSEELSAAAVRAYPTEPEAILRRLRTATAGQGPSPNGALWIAINDALRGPPLPGRLTAGLYRALATLPGVTLDGSARDRLGRQAVRLGYHEPGSRERRTLLLDARTYRRLGEQTVVASADGAVPNTAPPTATTAAGATTEAADAATPAFPAGTVLSESLVLRAGVTDRIGGPLRGR